MTKFTFPNSEKELEMTKVISKNGEVFLSLNFWENAEPIFEVKLNKVQLDYVYNLACTTLKE